MVATDLPEDYINEFEDPPATAPAPYVQLARAQSPKLDPSPLHTHTFAFDELPTAIRYFKDKVDGAIKVVIKPQEFRD